MIRKKSDGGRMVVVTVWGGFSMEVGLYEVAVGVNSGWLENVSLLKIKMAEGVVYKLFLAYVGLFGEKQELCKGGDRWL